MLIENGIDVNRKTFIYGVPALAWAGNLHINVKKRIFFLKKKLFNPNTDKRDDIVEILVSNGADPDYKDLNGVSLLHKAAYYGTIKMNSESQPLDSKLFGCL